MTSVYIKHTTSWIKDFVIKYNLCPFAALPFQQEQISYVVVENEDLAALVEQVLLECIKLQKADPKEVETTLVIHPKLLSDFQEYLGVVAHLEESLEKLELAGIIQLATFHPEYQFAETNPDDPENFTNRSPYPMIHILRENSVEKAINLHPDTQKIPQENIATMNRIGTKRLIQKNNEIIRKN